MENPEQQVTNSSNAKTSETPKNQNSSNKPKIFFIGFVILSILIAFIAGGFILREPFSVFDAFKSPLDIVKPQKPCTMEAKICPDGTAVGRTGPNCEFAPCPNTSEGKFCGGIAGERCPTGYKCKLDGYYPDAGGKCVKE